MKAPGTPAQGKALGAGKVKPPSAKKPARVNPAPASVEPKEPKAVKAVKAVTAPKAPETPKAAAPAVQTPPGQSAAAPPDQARKQDDSPRRSANGADLHLWR